MKIIIEHGKTKRIIDGPFNICIGIKELNELKNIIDTTLEGNFNYGWINIEDSM